MTLPTWLAIAYLGSNTVLNFLNVYWCAKMIQALPKRFWPPNSTPKMRREALRRTWDVIQIKKGSCGLLMRGCLRRESNQRTVSPCSKRCVRNRYQTNTLPLMSSMVFPRSSIKCNINVSLQVFRFIVKDAFPSK